jgi:sterol desaturase/sphingolipid hydroxylase (fatty acid hydroxylase superfamily)
MASELSIALLTSAPQLHERRWLMGRGLLKSEVGIPGVQFASGRIDLTAEARKARRRLLPVTVLYTAYAVTVLSIALSSGQGAFVVFAFLLCGVVLWTLVEYLVHRFVLHGRFPDGAGIARRWAHRSFDHLHVEHHARPWDGNHVNGTIEDTGPYMAFLAALSFAAPVTTLPVLWAAVMQSYVVEEWIHHVVHYRTVYGLVGSYWRSVARHHTSHHSALGSDSGFGLSSGAWDAVFGTRARDEPAQNARFDMNSPNRPTQYS